MNCATVLLCKFESNKELLLLLTTLEVILYYEVYIEVGLGVKTIADPALHHVEK